MKEHMKIHQINQLLITNPKSLNYFSKIQIDPQERFLGLLIDSDETHTVFSNALFLLKDTDQYQVRTHYDHQNPIESLQDFLVGPVVGIDRWLRAEYVLQLQELFPDIKFVDGSNIIEGLQTIKSSAEIEKMKEASRLNDLVMSQIVNELKVGVTERQIEQRLLELFREVGSDGPSFDPIVAFGENAADPHAVVSDRVLLENESIILDFGCIKEGYCSDMTRTYFLQNNPLKEVYDLVLKAQLAAIEAIVPQATFADVDRAARDLIEAAGYGEYFFHRLGHGIGQSVHEPFDVSSSNPRTIMPGMCFSIEPGIYLEGVGGVRIEDLVYVNHEGYAVVLNHVEKDKEILSII